MRPAEHALQVVVGTSADQLAEEIRAALQRPQAAAAEVPATAPASASAAWTGDAAAVLQALGGRGNVREVNTASSRLRIMVADSARLDREALARLGLRGVALPAPGCVHLIVGPDAAAAGAALLRLLPRNGHGGNIQARAYAGALGFSFEPDSAYARYNAYIKTATAGTQGDAAAGLKR